MDAPILIGLFLALTGFGFGLAALITNNRKQKKSESIFIANKEALEECGRYNKRLAEEYSERLSNIIDYFFVYQRWRSLPRNTQVRFDAECELSTSWDRLSEDAKELLKVISPKIIVE